MINLENLLDGSIADRNFQALARLGIDTGGQSVGIRFGVATLSWTASTDSAVLTVTHGLGRTPVVVVANSFSAASFASVPYCTTLSFTSTSFGLAGIVRAAFTGSTQVCWVAIG
jgi:hypothetical protein